VAEGDVIRPATSENGFVVFAIFVPFVVQAAITG